MWVAIGASTAAQVMGGLIAAWRQIGVLRLLGYSLGALQSIQICFSGLAVSQVAISFIGGDLWRAVQLVQSGVSRKAAGQAMLLDRMFGLAAIVVMVATVLPVLLGLAHDQSDLQGIWIIAAIVTCGASALFLSPPLLQIVTQMAPEKVRGHRLFAVGMELAGVGRFLLAAPRQSAFLTGISAIAHALNIFGIVLIAGSLGVPTSPWLIAAVAIPVMFVSMLPVSVAGWGVREAAMVTGFSLLNLAPEIALSTSIGFGLSRIAASLPGVLSLIAYERQPLTNTYASKRRTGK